MILSIHQVNFLPWIGYLAKIAFSDRFVILDHLQFSKAQFENRVKIKTRVGPKWLTVPVKKASTSLRSIREVEIDYNTKWQRKIVNLLVDAYRESTYFYKYFPQIKQIILNSNTYLFNLNIDLLNYLLKILGIKTPLLFSSELGVSHLRAHEMNMAIIQKLGCKTYLSGIMGKKYLIEKDFLEKNILLKYQNLQYPSYPQQWSQFTSGLSVIDYIFNCGVQNFSKIISPYYQL